MTRVVAPVASGVLSALGLVVSERRRDVVESVLLSGDALTREAIAAVVERLGARGREELGAPEAEVRATYDLRYAGQAFELPVEGELAPDPAELRRAFDRAHAERYGYEDPDAELELVTVRVAVALPGRRAAARRGRRSGGATAPGVTIFELPGSTLVVPRGWSAEVGDDAVVMERERRERARPDHAPGDARRAARGLRRDGRRARALGPLGEHQGAPRRLDRAVRRARADGDAGRAHPRAPRRDADRGRGGARTRSTSPATPGSSTTPTAAARTCPTSRVISPVFAAGELVGFAASRAHHADVGAREPGSMPADSRTLEDEGVVIPPSRLDDELLRELAGRMRNPRQREADLRAQLAANRTGAARLEALAERFGLDTVRAGMEETLDYAERRTRARIAELEDGVREAEDVLEAADGDLELQAARDRRRATSSTLDFTRQRPASTTATSTARCR